MQAFQLSSVTELKIHYVKLAVKRMKHNQIPV